MEFRVKPICKEKADGRRTAAQEWVQQWHRVKHECSRSHRRGEERTKVEFEGIITENPLNS